MEKSKSNNSALLLILLAMFVYVFSYVGRKAYDSNINNVMGFYDVEKDMAGLVGTFFFIAYALGQVVHGIFCRRYPKRLSVPLAVIVSSVVSLSIGLMPKEGFKYIKYLWMINGFCLASLWPSFIYIFANNLAKPRKKTALFLMAFPVSVGTFTSYGLSALFTYFNNFKLIFYTSSVLLFLVGIIWLISYDGLIKKCREEKIELDGIGLNEKAKELEKVDSKTDAVKKAKVITGAVVIMFILAIIDNFVKDGVNTWSQSIFKEKYGMPNWLSILISVGIPLCGVVGSTSALLLYRKLKNIFLLDGLLFFGGSVVICILLLFFNTDIWVITLICFMVTYSIMAGINNTITNIFPMQEVGSSNSGLIAGLLDGFCYVGSAISSYGLGAVAKNFDWSVCMYILLSVCALAVVLCLVLTIIKKLKLSKNTKNA